MKWLGIPVRSPTWKARDRPLEPRHDITSPMIKLAGSHKKSRTVCMYVFIYVSMYVYRDECTYVCTYVCMYTWMHVCTYVCMHVCMYVFIYVSKYVCTHVCIFIYLFKHAPLPM